MLTAGGQDAKRFLYTLHDRAWLTGLGWYIVGKAGQLLDRSIVDRSVFDASRLVFEAAPDLEPPLRQGRREALHEGAPLDAIASCPDLTASERADLARVQTAAKQALGRECEGGGHIGRQQKGLPAHDGLLLY